MPVIGTYGGASVAAWGRRQMYKKPPMLTTVGTGAISVTPSSPGYTVTGDGAQNFAYLNAGKSSGKWYWEQKYVSGTVNGVMTGITNAPGTPVVWAGYSSDPALAVNAGMYTVNESFWNEYGSIPAIGGATPVDGDVIGFAMDLDSLPRTLKIYRNNALIGTISWFSTLTLYPIFGFQGVVTVSVQLGPRCTYALPVNYKYI